MSGAAAGLLIVAVLLYLEASKAVEALRRIAVSLEGDNQEEAEPEIGRERVAEIKAYGRALEVVTDHIDIPDDKWEKIEQELGI